MQKFATIKDMLRFIRMWYLLHRLTKKCTKDIPNNSYEITGSGLFVAKEVFLEQAADKYFGLIRRSEKRKKERMLQDKSILDLCEKGSPPKVYQEPAWKLGVGHIAKHPNAILIQTTGAGDDFADITNFIAEFCNKYKAIWVLLLGVIAWSPEVRSWLITIACEHYPLLNFCF